MIFFLLCAGGFLYILVGYPLLLALLARIWSRPSKAGPFEPTVSVLLPVHNGEPWLEQKLQNLLALDYPREKVQIVVISDGSEDRTEEIARRYPVQLISMGKRGKAAALNRGLQAATGEILFFTDVRQKLNTEALRRLMERFADPEVGVATGELIILDGSTQEEARVGLYWEYEKWIRKRLSRLDSVLGATGCIYAMRRALAHPMPEGTLLDDVHLPMQAFFAGYRIVMEDRALAYDSPTGLGTEFWRKVRTQAGIYQLIGQFPALLWPGTRMWLHFVSYKLGRLLLPFLLLGLAGSSLLLPDPERWLAIGAQALFYLLALSNRWVGPRAGLLKRITSMASTFVVLVSAAFCGIALVFVPASKLWRTRSPSS